MGYCEPRLLDGTCLQSIIIIATKYLIRSIFDEIPQSRFRCCLYNLRDALSERGRELQREKGIRAGPIKFQTLFCSRHNTTLFLSHSPVVVLIAMFALRAAGKSSALKSLSMRTISNSSSSNAVPAVAKPAFELAKAGSNQQSLETPRNGAEYALSSLDKIVNWGRAGSLWPMVSLHSRTPESIRFVSPPFRPILRSTRQHLPAPTRRPLHRHELIPTTTGLDSPSLVDCRHEFTNELSDIESPSSPFLRRTTLPARPHDSPASHTELRWPRQQFRARFKNDD